jgi:uncharacterized protein (UPF0332 family)
MSTAYSESFKIMEKAEEAIEAAEYNINGGFSLAATNRAYYACYYCMAALLLTQNVYAKTHQGVRGKFSELFIKTAIFPDFIATYIKAAFDLRQEADYDFDADISIDVATTVVSNTKEFYQYALTYLKNLNLV